jgi:hypothetical protein
LVLVSMNYSLIYRPYCGQRIRVSSNQTSTELVSQCVASELLSHDWVP